MARGLLRDRGEEQAEVSNLELFFDLVYVFAVTQIALSCANISGCSA